MNKLGLIISVFIFIFFSTVLSFAEEDDLSLIAKSQYFSLYGQKELDAYSLLTKLHFDYFLQPEVALKKDSQDSGQILASVLDALYLEVSDLLDIHIYSFHGKIRILPDQDSVGRVFKKIFGVDFDERSFYIYDNNTIYISLSDLNIGMLGHEIAHAIISSYFVVPPPAKVQEVLSGYVEYSLRKSTNTLP